jgi:PIN domain nuclease of toxin-antitoxin system
MILLDTCVLIWNAIEPNKLSPKAKKAIEYSENELLICDISIWEISMLIKKNRLTVNNSPSGFTNLIIQSHNFQIQQITPEIAELSVNFGSEINDDPTDRLIAATSILKNIPIITADQNLRDATILETIW